MHKREWWGECEGTGHEDDVPVIPPMTSTMDDIPAEGNNKPLEMKVVTMQGVVW